MPLPAPSHQLFDALGCRAGGVVMSNQQHGLKLLMGWRVGLTGLHQVFTLEWEEHTAWVGDQRSARDRVVNSQPSGERKVEPKGEGFWV